MKNLSVSGKLLHTLARRIEAQRMNPGKIFELAGIDSSVNAQNTDADGRVPVDLFLTVWDLAVDRSGDENFGLRFGKDLAENYLSGNILINIMANCPTVEKAMRVFCRYHVLMEDAVLPHLHMRGDNASLCWETVLPGMPIPRHHAEALLCACRLIFSSISEGQCHPTEIRFGHARPPDTSLHRDIFNVPLVFEKNHNALVYDRRSLDRPIHFASRDLFETLEAFAEEKLASAIKPASWSDNVRNTVKKRLLSGERADIKTIAASMALSPRNLQNKLKMEETSFTLILDQIRKDAALRHLKRADASICDAAFLSGFSEQSAFNHAFKRWTGMTPGEYRKKMG